jgi:tRNA-2-methylthio-N6-dimethylallyladenosine synthase
VTAPKAGGLPPTFYLRSFGCQMNDHDAERIAGMLAELGMRRVDAPDEAYVLVYNTCSIREKADNRLAGHLGGAKRLKAAEPRRLVVITGCLAQSKREAFLAEHPFVDVLVGPQSLHELPQLLHRRLETGRPSGAFQEATTRWSADLPRARRTGPLAWVQIMTGCTNFCSYCIVPHVRGPEASRPAASVVEEVVGLAAEGVREVTLLGQNVNAYGREPGFEGTGDFAAVLEAAASVPGIERVRFMTSHPKDVSGQLIEAMAGLAPVCEHLHLPVQSGSDRILGLMGRGYTRAHYLDLVARLRAAIPGLALTTDLIVGFPSETEQDFEETMSLVEECGFDGAFTFVYSARPGTKAAGMTERVSHTVAERRMRRLVDRLQFQGTTMNQEVLGSVVEVLVEGVSKHDRGHAMGRTRTHKIVNASAAGAPPPPGSLVQVRLESCTSTSFRGRIVD